jgi:hypothetical protein
MLTGQDYVMGKAPETVAPAGPAQGKISAALPVAAIHVSHVNHSQVLIEEVRPPQIYGIAPTEPQLAGHFAKQYKGNCGHNCLLLTAFGAHKNSR